MEKLLPLLVAIPLFAAFLLPLIDKIRNGSGISRFLAPFVSLVLLILVFRSLASSEVTYWVGGWTPESGALGISLVLDKMSSFMLLVINVTAFAVILYSHNYMRRYTSESIYYCLFFLMVTGMNGLVLAGDIFNLYVFLEIAAMASYALVAFGCDTEELEASFKYLVLGTVGSSFIIMGIAILYNQTGHLNMAQISLHLPAQNMAILMAGAFFMLGFGLKAAMVPFHAWLPDAHPSAPAPISAMLSGVLIKALGVYTLLRVFFTVLGMSFEFAHIFMVLGALSMVIGVCLAVVQWDFKRLLAYHSISQMGYVVLAMGVAGEMMISQKLSIASLALLGALFHLMNHAAFKSLLFLCSGAAEYATGTRLLKQLGGLKHRMPVTSGCLRIAAFSISGIPPFNGFWSKLIIVIAVFQAGHYGLGALTVLVSFMTLLSFIKVQRYVLDGDPSPCVEKAREVPFAMGLAMVLLALICVFAGLLLPYFKPFLLDQAGSVLVQNVPQVIHLAAGG